MTTAKHLTAHVRRRPPRATRSSGARFGRLALCAAVLVMLVMAPGAAAAAAGVDVNTVEGQSFTATVVSGLICPLRSATISWGDGTTSAGTSDGNNGIQGTHTYAEEGSYGGSVAYSYASSAENSCPFLIQTASFQATVHDAPLSAAGMDISGTAGQSITGVVAHFSDANPGATAADFSVTIQWGDGTTTTGTVSASGPGGFDVSGTHSYAGTGSFTVSAAITDVGGSTATATGTATIGTASTSPPRIVGIDPVGSPAAGRPIVLKATISGPVTAIEWNLAGNSDPEISCAGSQTAVTFRAPAGSRSVTAVAVGAGGSRLPFTATIDVAPAPPMSAADRRLAGRVAAALAKHPPVYVCAAPSDFKLVRVGSKHLPNLVDSIQTRNCTTPRTLVEGNLQLVGCLRRITSFSEIPAAERGIIFPVSKSTGSAIKIVGRRSLSSNDATAIASANLVFELSDVYVSTGVVKMNGLTVNPGPDAAVLAALQYDRLVSSDSGMSVGALGLQNARSFMFNLAGTGGQIPLGSFARAAGGLADIAGFGLGGNVRVTLDDSGGTFGLTIRVHLELPSFLQIGGVTAQGDVTLRATNGDGLVIDQLRIGPIAAEVAGLGIDGLQLDYTRATQEWDGQGSACIIDGACLDMIPPNGGVVIRNGGLYRASASLDFPDPGIELFAGVALNRIGFGIGLDPTRVLANAKLTAEGILEIDGHLVMAFPSAAAPFVLDRAEVGDAFPGDFYNRSYTSTLFAIGADAYIDLPIAGRTKLGGAYLLYQYPGYVGLGGGIEAHFAGIVDLTGRVDGEFNFANGRFSIKGDITACVVDVCAGAIGAVSDRGAGACVSFLGLNFGGGVVFSPFKIKLWPFDGCRWSPFVDTGVHPARDGRIAAAGTTIPITIRRGSASRAIELDGIAGAPAVRVHTPDGKVLDGPAKTGLAVSPAVRIIRSTEHSITVVGLVHPVPGTYTIELLPGSPAVNTVSQASDQPPARVSASVRGHGPRRTLYYNVASRRAQRVTFIEQAGGGSRIIGTINGGGRGRISFSPAPGFDHRTVIAQFELDGLPAESVKVASFKPLSPRLGSVARLKLARHGSTLGVSWGAVSGATSYELVARLTIGGERMIRTHSQTISLKQIAPYESGVISVRAVATLRQGRPALARLSRIGRPPTRLEHLPRLTHRS